MHVTHACSSSTKPTGCRIRYLGLRILILVTRFSWSILANQQTGIEGIKALPPTHVAPTNAAHEEWNTSQSTRLPSQVSHPLPINPLINHLMALLLAFLKTLLFFLLFLLLEVT